MAELSSVESKMGYERELLDVILGITMNSEE